MKSQCKRKIVSFLRNLANSIEEKKLLSSQLKSVWEFYMVFQFQEQAIKDNKIDSKEDSLPIQSSNNNSFDNFSHDDMIKFIIMGWYIYYILLSDKQLPKTSCSLSESDEESDSNSSINLNEKVD